MTARIDRIFPSPAENLSDEDLTGQLGPGLRVNFVSSLDGAATHDGLSGGLSGAGDKRYFELLRRVCDVVLVGAGTVRAEGYGPMRVSAASAKWRVARGMAEQPVFAIVSSRLELDPSSQIFADAPVTPVIVTTSNATGTDRFDAMADVLIAGHGAHVDVGKMIAGLHDRGLINILCEGGPTLFGSLLAADAVDELSLTVSPSLEGGDATRITAGQTPSRSLTLKQVLKSGDDLLLNYARSGATGSA